MSTEPAMSANQTQILVRKILISFPNLDDDAERCRLISQEISRFEFEIAGKALDDYIHHGGDRWFELTRFLAIAYRMAREKSEREQAIKRALAGQASVRDYQAERERESRIEALIADMTDDDVMREWAPLLDELVGLPREWASQWPASKIRGNVRFKRRIGELLQA